MKNENKTIAQGAEAVITKQSIGEATSIVKNRISKSYRIPEIDSSLRKQRTKSEARLLSEARRAGVSTPQVLEVKDTTIQMELIKGKTVKEILTKLSETDTKQLSKIAYNIGTNIAKLHSAGIIHGDLTTSNMILRSKCDEKQSICELVFIDFGLGFFSKRLEDFAQDLAVLKEALKSTHFQIFNQIWPAIAKAYQWEQSEKVFKTLESIEKRGRYVRKTI